MSQTLVHDQVAEGAGHPVRPDAEQPQENPSAGANEFVWLEPFPHPLHHPILAMGWLFRVAAGIVSLLTLLTVVASVPILNLFALGYWLDGEAQVARSGRVRHLLPLIPAAIRVMTAIIGIIIFLIPLGWLAAFARDARLIAPNSPMSWLWNLALVTASLLVCVHLLLAVARGARMNCFVRPVYNWKWLVGQIRRGSFWVETESATQRFFRSLRPLHYGGLGVRAFLGTWVWLVLPSALYTHAWNTESIWAAIATLLAAAILVPLLALVPFLQIRFAVEQRWTAILDIGQVCRLTRRVPIAWPVSIVGLYALSVPLFLYSVHFRMHAPHRDFWWDLVCLSMICGAPARAVLGWAYHRATVGREAPRVLVWISRVVLASLLVAYVWLLYHVPLTHESHALQVMHHILVLPIPW